MHQLRRRARARHSRPAVADLRSCRSDAADLRDRHRPCRRQHVRADRARLPRHLRGLQHRQLLAGLLDDAGGRAGLHLRDHGSAGRCRSRSRWRSLLCALFGLRGRARAGAAVRRARLERLADGDGRRRHRARQRRAVHLRQGAARASRRSWRRSRSSCSAPASYPLQLVIPLVGHRHRRSRCSWRSTARGSARRCSRWCRTRTRRG